MVGVYDFDAELDGDFDFIPPTPSAPPPTQPKKAALPKFGIMDYDEALDGEVPLGSDSPQVSALTGLEDEGDEMSSEPKYDFSQTVPNSYLNALAQVESSGNPEAKAGTSSATGLYQFIDSTWLSMYKQHKRDMAAGMDNSSILALRTDPKVATEIVSRFTEGNSAYLTSKGIEPTNGNLYLAHFLGMGRAAKVLMANPNSPINEVVSDRAIKANPGVFRNIRTAGDLTKWAERKMAKASENYNYDVASLIDIPAAREQSDAQAIENDQPAQKQEREQITDGIWRIDGQQVRVEGGRMYDLKTGARLDADPVQDTGPDVGSITPGLNTASLEKQQGPLGNTTLEGAGNFIKDVVGANLGPNMARGYEESGLKGAMTEAAWELLPPGAEQFAKSMFLGLRSLKAGRSFAEGVPEEALTPKQQFQFAEVAAEGDKKVLEQMRKDTGWFRDTDGSLMYEIDDSLNAFKPNIKPSKYHTYKESLAKDSYGNYKNAEFTLEDIYDAPELYENYPHLKELQVAFFDDSGVSGFATSDGLAIGLSKNDWLNRPQEAKKTIVHELQHIIQKYEGWTSGNNGTQIRSRLLSEGLQKDPQFVEKLKKSVDDSKDVFEKHLRNENPWGPNIYNLPPAQQAMVIAAMKGGKAGEAYFNKHVRDKAGNILYKNLSWADIENGTPGTWGETILLWGTRSKGDFKDADAFIKEYEKTVKPFWDFEISADEAYLKTLGEVNARNVEARMDFSAETRKNVSPFTTKDVPEGQVMDKAGNLIIKKP